MPGFLLHQGATILCAHGGQARAMAPNPRVRVSGQATVTQISPYIVAGCPFTIAGAPSPCTTARWTTAALRVRAGGMPMLLGDSKAICDPTGAPVIVTGTQTRVRGQ